MEHNNTTRTLYDLLEKKCNAFRIFLSATEALKREFDDSNITKINMLIIERDNCIRNIDHIDIKLNIMRRNTSGIMAFLTPVQKKQFTKLMKDIEKTAKRAIHINRELESALLFECSNIKNEMVKVRKGKEGVKNYTLKPNLKSHPKFLDIKS